VREKRERENLEAEEPIAEAVEEEAPGDGGDQVHDRHHQVELARRKRKRKRKEGKS
jgi:hypothetical protein